MKRHSQALLILSLIAVSLAHGQWVEIHPSLPYVQCMATTGTNLESGASNVQLRVYDVLGREVAVLVNEVRQPGSYTAQSNGAGLASGTYFYRLEAGNFVDTKKLSLMK